jgi:fatty acid desaturase
VDDDFRALRRNLEVAGAFEYRPGHAMAALVANVAASMALLRAAAEAPLPWSLPLFVMGSFFFYRVGWLMHDGAHGAVFGEAGKDRWFTLATCLVLGEFPSGWQWGHGRHHAAPNVRGIDGDQAERWNPASRWGTRLEAALWILWMRRFLGLLMPRFITMLWIRDAVYTRTHFRDRFALELGVSLASHALQIGVFLSLFGPLGAVLWLLHVHLGLLYLNGAFLGNHYDRPSFDAGEHKSLDFATLQIVTSRNYSGGVLARFVFGGLEHQIEHHLFPALPRHGLLVAEPFVREYCRKRGLPYEVLPYTETLRRVLAFHVTPARTRDAASPL